MVTVVATAAAGTQAYGAYNANKMAKKQFKSQKEFNEATLAMQQEQLDLAKAEDERRKGVIAQMYKDAELTDAEVMEEVGDVDADIKHGFSKRRSALNRDMDRNKVNPSSGARAALNKDMDIAEALATAGGRNTTRRALRDREDMEKKAVQSADLGLPNATIPAYNSGMNIYSQMANQAGAAGGAYSQAANEMFSSMFDTAGMVAAMKAKTPAGGTGGAPIDDYSFSSSNVGVKQPTVTPQPMHRTALPEPQPFT